jgi:hypothetical protein
MIARKRPRECAEHDPVGQRATRPRGLPTKHRQLVAQHEDLHRVPVLRSTTHREQLDEAPEHPVKDGSDHQPIVPAATGQRRTEFPAPTGSEGRLFDDGRSPCRSFPRVSNRLGVHEGRQVVTIARLADASRQLEKPLSTEPSFASKDRLDVPSRQVS